MIRGIGVDSVDCKRMREVLERTSFAFLRRTFTKAELEASPADAEVIRRIQSGGDETKETFYRWSDRAVQYFAAQFAVKEAVFKAVAHHLPEKTFDLRIVEAFRREDGSPYVNREGALGAVLDAAGISNIHLSITTEANLATAFVVAES